MVNRTVLQAGCVTGDVAMMLVMVGGVWSRQEEEPSIHVYQVLQSNVQIPATVFLVQFCETVCVLPGRICASFGIIPPQTSRTQTLD